MTNNNVSNHYLNAYRFNQHYKTLPNSISVNRNQGSKVNQTFHYYHRIPLLYIMQRELYFDISAEGSGGSLYRITDDKGNTHFIYQHSTYDNDRDEIKTFETPYASFARFWQMLVKDPQWFYQHPLYVHTEQRAFVKEQLQHVHWNIHPNKKWQESHQRQWKKVLTDKDDYYRSTI